MANVKLAKMTRLLQERPVTRSSACSVSVVDDEVKQFGILHFSARIQFLILDESDDGSFVCHWPV